MGANIGVYRPVHTIHKPPILLPVLHPPSPQRERLPLQARHLHRPLSDNRQSDRRQSDRRQTDRRQTDRRQTDRRQTSGRRTEAHRPTAPAEKELLADGQCQPTVPKPKGAKPNADQLGPLEGLAYKAGPERGARASDTAVQRSALEAWPTTWRQSDFGVQRWPLTVVKAILKRSAV